MEKKSETRVPHLELSRDADESFPETQQTVLIKAARGQWDPFVREYLHACWRELIILCRRRGIPLPEAEDLIQDLMVRAMQDGGFGSQVRTLLREADDDSSFRGNLAEKYLKYRSLPVPPVRFRTFLKSVLQNVVREADRRRCRDPSQLPSGQIHLIEPCIEESVARFIDERWLRDCLLQASAQLRADSEAARTRGERRLFQILCLSTIDGKVDVDIAEFFGIDRTTASGLLTRARARFVASLQKITEVEDPAQLKGLVGRYPDALGDALSAVRREA